MNKNRMTKVEVATRTTTGVTYRVHTVRNVADFEESLRENQWITDEWSF